MPTATARSKGYASGLGQQNRASSVLILGVEVSLFLILGRATQVPRLPPRSSDAESVQTFCPRGVLLEIAIGPGCRRGALGVPEADPPRRAMPNVHAQLRARRV